VDEEGITERDSIREKKKTREFQVAGSDRTGGKSQTKLDGIKGAGSARKRTTKKKVWGSKKERTWSVTTLGEQSLYKHPPKFRGTEEEQKGERMKFGSR